MHEEVALLTSLVTGTPTTDAQAWQSQMMLIFQLLLPATGLLLQAPLTAIADPHDGQLVCYDLAMAFDPGCDHMSVRVKLGFQCCSCTS